MRSKHYLAAVFSGLFALGCGEGCDNSGVSNNDEDGVFVAPDGAVCADATPCGNCDQDCRLHGNPFLPGGDGGDGSGGGGDGSGTSGGSGGGTGGAGIGGSAGGGGTGYDGEACALNSDCRGLCASGVCTGFGDGGFNGDSCLSAADCRGECDGDGICIGSGSDPGFGGGSDGTGGGGTGGGGTGGDGTGGGDGTDGGGGTGTPTDGGTPGTGGGGGTTTPGQNVCLDLEINLQHAIPTIALLIDQSSSMLEDFGSGMNRWEAEYHSLMDPNDGIIKQIEGGFRIGMSLYSSENGGPDCPLLADVRPELNNYEPINRVFTAAFPIEDTPTGESILGTLRQFDVHPDQGRKIILLATDGEPDTCQDPDPQNGQPESVAAAQEAYAVHGVETILLSVGDEVGAPHLEDMANAGVGLPVGGAQQAPYYTADDPEQLRNEMQNIIASARSCIFRVQGGIIDPGIVDQSTVTLDGVAIQYNHPDGWRYHQNQATCQGSKQCIELTGQACDLIQDGNAHTILGDFLCTYYDPDNPPISGSGGGTGGGTIGGTGDGSGGSNDGGSGTGGGDTGGGGTGGGGGGGGPGQCLAASASCAYDGDCCSGVCSSQVNGICVIQ